MVIYKKNRRRVYQRLDHFGYIIMMMLKQSSVMVRRMQLLMEVEGMGSRWASGLSAAPSAGSSQQSWGLQKRKEHNTGALAFLFDLVKAIETVLATISSKRKPQRNSDLNFCFFAVSAVGPLSHQ